MCEAHRCREVGCSPCCAALQKGESSGQQEGGRKWLPSAITQPFRNQEAQGKIEYLRKLLYLALRQNVGLSLSDPGLPTTVLTRMMGRKCSEL